MKTKRQFKGTIEQAVQEVEKLKRAGLEPKVELTITLDLPEFVQVREKKAPAQPVKA